jgi:hypothetical protein
MDDIEVSPSSEAAACYGSSRHPAYSLGLSSRVLGRGQRLFADATEVQRLRLVESESFRSGIVLLRYRTA